MTTIFPLLRVLTLSFLITRCGTAVLALTGVSYELAHLQGVSAPTRRNMKTQEGHRHE